MGGVLAIVRSDEGNRRVLHVTLGVAALGVGLLVARLPLVTALLILGIGAVALTSLVEPMAGVAASLFLAPLWAWLRADWPQVPPLLGQYVFLLTCAVWLVRGLARRALVLPHPPLLLPLVAFMGSALLSLWDPADAVTGGMELAKWGQVLLIFLLVYERLRERTEASWGILFLGSALVGVTLFQSAAGLWQFGLRGTGPSHFAIDARFYRAYGTFEQPNPYGGFLGMSAAVLAGLFFVGLLESWQQHRRPALWVWGSGGALLCVGGALLASWSRGAWMGFGAALLLIVLTLPRRGAWGWGALVILGIVGVGLYTAGLFPASVMARMTGFLDYTRFEDIRGVAINATNYSVLERMAHWQAALEMWRENFWLGVGFGCYEPAYPLYRLINWPIALGHAHNYYLNLLAETGIVGLGAYLTFFGVLFLRLWQASRRLSDWRDRKSVV